MEIRNQQPSSRSEYDRELVAIILQGKHSAFAELMDYYYEAIFFTLLKMIKDKNSAADLTSIVFERAFRHINQYSPEFAFSTWLFRIATNACIDSIRKMPKQTISIDDYDYSQGDLQLIIKDQNPDPEGELINKQRAKEIREMLTLLKPAYKDLIELRFFKEFSYEEIANHLNIPMGTVKTQLHRAKEQLLKIYTQQNQDND